MNNLSRSESQNFSEVPDPSTQLHKKEKLEKEFSNLLLEAQALEKKFNNLINYSQAQGIKVSKQVEKMNNALENPEFHQAHQNKTFVLLREIKMRQVYCNQIELKISKKSKQNILSQEITNKKIQNLKKEGNYSEYAFEKWIDKGSRNRSLIDRSASQ